MSIGHGSFGLLSRLRSFYHLQQNPKQPGRRPFLEIQLGKAIEDGGHWTADGSNQKTTISADSLIYAGAYRPIVAVHSAVSPRPLTRVYRLADMAAGKWYVSEAAMVPGASTDLYVRLPDSSDPDSTTIVLLLLFTFGTEGEVYPALGAQRILDPGVEDWFSASDLNQYSEETTGVTIARSTEVAPWSKGIYSAQIAANGLGAGAAGGILQAPQFLSGDELWLAGSYFTSADMPSTVHAALRVRIDSGTTLYMTSDGLTTAGSVTYLRLDPTYGEWLRFLFVLRVPQDTTTASLAWLLYNSGGGATSIGSCRFDDLTVRNLIRHVNYAPALGASSIPEREVMSQSVLFGPKTMSIGGVSLLDGDGTLTTAFAQLLPFNKPATLYTGGDFSNGEEVYRDDWGPSFPALIRKPVYRDGEIGIELEDARSLTRAQALRAAYRFADFATMARFQEGAPKALLFGDTASPIIKAVRVTLDANGYGGYEFLDPRVPVADGVPVGLPAGWIVKAYPSEELADKDEKGYLLKDDVTAISVANPTQVTCFKRHGLATNDQVTISGSNSTPTVDGRRTVTVVDDFKFTVAVNVTVAGNAGQVVSHADIDYSNQNTRWQVKRDLRNYRYDRAGEDVGTGVKFPFKIAWVVTEENRYLDFDITGGIGAAVRAAVATGSYMSGSSLATAVQTAMRAVGDATINVSYGSNKITIARAGNIILMFGLGATVEAQGGGSLHRDIGFKTQDTANAASHTGDYESFYDLTTPPLVASLDVEGPAWKLARDLRQALRDAVGGGDTTMDCSYSENVHAFTVSKSSGVLSLVMPSIPANSPMEPIPEKSGWGVLGYDTRTNKTGGTSYTSDQATFTDADTDHVLRWSGGGYYDDAAGSICGTASVSLNTPPAVASWLLQKVLDQPAATIDVSGSFADARDDCIGDFCLLFAYYGNGEDDVFEALGNLERVGTMDIVIDADSIDGWIWRCKRWVTSTAGAVALSDSDFLSWEMWQEPAAIFEEVRIYGAYHPALGRFQSWADAPLLDPAMAVKHGADGKVFELPGFLDRAVIEGGTQLVGGFYGDLIAAVLPVAQFEVQGKLSTKLIGDKVLLTRERAFSTTGVLSSVAFRIIGLKHNDATGITRCLAVKDAP